MSGARSFLFLQGVCSPFFAHLSDRLKERGHNTYKINFNVGDCSYWGLRSAQSFHGSISELHEFIIEVYRTQSISDQILFGDCRPIHRIAVEAGKLLGVRTHVFEEGYFRPYWVTLEREGVNRNSLLPRDPQWYYNMGDKIKDYDGGKPFRSTFGIRAFHDVVYHCSGLWNPLFFPKYRTHAPSNAAAEYFYYSKRLSLLGYHEKCSSKKVIALIQSAKPFYFFPLQLGSDAQIRNHSTFKDMIDVIEVVMRSFAENAPTETCLVIKNHPLDSGQINYKKKVDDLAIRLNVAGRIVYLEGGDLSALLRYANGTVTVNSTVGALSLELRCPTIALGEAIYNIPGLTYQGHLDKFWPDPKRPDPELFRRFRNTVMYTTQVNGGFYSKEGIALAIENSVPSLERDLSPLEELL